jgi:hypothetical protein
MTRIGLGETSLHKTASTCIDFETSFIALFCPRASEIVSWQSSLIASIKKLVHSFWFVTNCFCAIIKDLSGALLSADSHHFSSQSRVPMSGQGLFHSFDPGNISPNARFRNLGFVHPLLVSGILSNGRLLDIETIRSYALTDSGSSVRADYR